MPHLQIDLISAIVFESFEDGAGNNSDDYHSGYNCLTPATGYTLIDSVTPSSRLYESGAIINFWAKDGAASPCDVRVGSITVTPTFIARSGEWSLYEAIINPNQLPTSGARIAFDINVISAGSPALKIDDVRMQPLDAQATCYVYDAATFRLLAQFDDQHFGLYYQYSAEGKLTRRIIETVDGMKTVQETQYHTPLSARRGYGLGIASTEGISSSVFVPMRPGVDATRPGLQGMPRLEGGQFKREGDNEFDLFNLEMNPDDGQLRILDVDTLNLHGKEGN